MSVKQVSAQWWMPRHESAMKDVASCDKPRGAASEHRSGDFRMGKPIQGHAWISPAEYIGGGRRTRGTDTSKYPKEEKSTRFP